MKNFIRTFVAAWYLLGWMAHVYLGLANPQMYEKFGDTALLPVLTDLWRSLIFPNITVFALVLAVIEIGTGSLLIWKGQVVKLGLLLSIAFNLFLVTLGLSYAAPDGQSDFLVNRMPNMLFILLQLPLMRLDYKQSIPEIIANRLTGRTRQPVTRMGVGR